MQALITAQAGRPRYRPLTRASLAVPLTLGVAFGAYVWWLARGTGYTVGATVAGLVGGAVMVLLCFAIGRVQHALARGPRASAYGLVFGCAMGWLFALSGRDVLASSFFGAAMGAAMFGVVFYYLYTHQLAARMEERRPWELAEPEPAQAPGDMRPVEAGEQRPQRAVTRQPRG
ncbi:hypothetical protein [Streptomyces sp. JJ36]|uniref:hypothetical protein n=1 Tax=Streptomyces sp. JJ36 TaxID=2736645 RepID=UPI001F271D56|nr:hypothetical protein [Streptomyces sp. JJ36]MCF6525655.1 hypothetical protein [Streptomyces sp. JJ36]